MTDPDDERKAIERRMRISEMWARGVLLISLTLIGWGVFLTLGSGPALTVLGFTLLALLILTRVIR